MKFAKFDYSDESYIYGVSCAICICDFSDGDQICRLDCKHYFHTKCSDKWIQLKSTCPTCRAFVSTDELVSKLPIIQELSIINTDEEWIMHYIERSEQPSPTNTLSAVHAVIDIDDVLDNSTIIPNVIQSNRRPTYRRATNRRVNNRRASNRQTTYAQTTNIQTTNSRYQYRRYSRTEHLRDYFRQFAT